MSKKWRKSISVVILVSFIALLLPKSLWHDCSHGQHEGPHRSGKTSKHALQQGVEKCYACDLHIPLLSNPLEHQHALQNRFVSEQVTVFFRSAAFGIAPVETLRGPPAEMI